MGASLTAAAPSLAQAGSAADADASAMTEEQMEAERRAALASMPVFGGGFGGSVKSEARTSAPSPLACQQAAPAAATPMASFGFGVPSAAAADGSGPSGAQPPRGAAAAWPGLVRVRPDSADGSASASQQTSPANIFGRLSNASGPADRLPNAQQVSEAPILRQSSVVFRAISGILRIADRALSCA